MRVYSTIAKFSLHQMICLMLLLVAMLSSCVSEQVEPEVPAPPVVEEPDSMSLLLACAPENSTQALTRLADEVVQLNYYRKITNFRFVALKNGVVTDCSIDNPSNSINRLVLSDTITLLIAAWSLARMAFWFMRRLTIVIILIQKPITVA